MRCPGRKPGPTLPALSRRADGSRLARESVLVAVSCTAGRQRRWGTNKKQDGLGVRYGKSASPAKAGARPSSAQQADKRIPAFAGKAIRWRFYQGRVGRPAGGQLA